ncbi:hypothetical protein ABXS75_15065 [Roseburia hominis]
MKHLKKLFIISLIIGTLSMVTSSFLIPSDTPTITQVADKGGGSETGNG